MTNKLVSFICGGKAELGCSEASYLHFEQGHNWGHTYLQRDTTSRLESDKGKTSPGILVDPGAIPREPVDGGDKIVCEFKKLLYVIDIT